MARKPLKERLKGFGRNQFTCACCPGKTFRGYRALNAHHLARHGNYWAGQKARVAGRKIGKAADAARRHARGWQEAHGLLDHRGKATARMRSRPSGPVRRIKDLKARDRHARDHDRAEHLDRRAGRHEARGSARAARLRGRAQARRGRHPQRPAPAARPAPAMVPQANGRTNGHAPRPLGRLAPSRPAPVNGRSTR